MKIKYKDKITGEVQIKECTEIGCKNTTECEDGCIGFLPAKCADCEDLQLVFPVGKTEYYAFCPHCIKDCRDDELGQHGEPIVEYLEERDPMDLAKDKFLNEFQRGEH